MGYKLNNYTYRVSIDISGYGAESKLLYEGDDKKLAESFIPPAYRSGALNGSPSYLLTIMREVEEGEVQMEGIRYVWQESFLTEK